jgi:hypothetical protein
MQYMLIHVVDREIESEEERMADESALSVWLQETERLGVNLQGSRLRSTGDATTVRIRNENVLLTDGPFVETKEQIAGYDVLDCKDLTEAIGWAAQHPTTRRGSIEVRPLFGDPPRETLPAPLATKRRYLLLVCVDVTIAISQEEGARMGPATDEWVNRAEENGARLYGSRLEAEGTAHTVRVQDGQVIVSDGPFMETKEQIAGFDVLECGDLDEALDLATGHPMARYGAMEVRPFWPFGEA